MATIYDANTQELIKKVANALKEKIKDPTWSMFVKTGVAKERPPLEKDWWYMRAASILRKVYLLGPIGTNKLRVKYSSRKNRGYTPEKTFSGSGKIIRTILQQLEQIEFIKKTEKIGHKGRVITPKGKSFLDKLAK
jgi:small subunit ribosomal protein S19e